MCGTMGTYNNKYFASIQSNQNVMENVEKQRVGSECNKD